MIDRVLPFRVQSVCMKLPELVVADKVKLEEAEFKAKWWLAGWVVAGVVSVMSGFIVAQTFRLTRLVEDTQHEQRELADQQRSVANAQAATLASQKSQGDLLISWGSFIKDRDDLIHYNHEHAPEPMLTKAARPPTKATP